MEAPSNWDATGSRRRQIVPRNGTRLCCKGTPLAKLAFDAKARPAGRGGGGAQFLELQGTAAGQSDSRLLLVEPGKKHLLPRFAAGYVRENPH